MAIQVQGTTVIDDSKNLLNLQQIQGGLGFVGPCVNSPVLANDGNIDLTQGNVFTIMPTTNITITPINSTPTKGLSYKFNSLVLIVKPNGYSVAFSSNFKWANGVAPVATDLYGVYLITCIATNQISMSETVFYSSWSSY